jgi:UDP-glucose 4-epimerase
MNLLLTGGTGYVGSHVVVVLAVAGHHAVLLDNLCNSDAGEVHRKLLTQLQIHHSLMIRMAF